MTIVAGFSADEQGKDALALGGMLARSSGEPLVVLAAIRRPWPLPLSGTDVAELEDHARASFEEVRDSCDDIPVEFMVQRTRSVPTALLSLAGERDAGLVVLGSGRDGVLGHVSLGSTSNHVVHSSGVAVALAPRGLRCTREARVKRVSLAFGGSERSSLFAVAAAAKAAEYGVAMRLVSFMARSRPEFTMTLGAGGDSGIFDLWEAEMALALDRAMDELRDLPDPPVLEPPEIGEGSGWREALESIEWTVEDLLVLGSSEAAPAARVFLGSRANKILKFSPVPVVVLPSEHAEEIADRSGGKVS